MSKTCKFFEDATIFDSDFNETEYKYCTLFGEECKKIKRTKNCPYRLNLKLSKYKHALEEIRDIASQTIIDYTEIVKNNEKLKALDIRNRMSEIQNIITEAIGK